MILPKLTKNIALLTDSLEDLAGGAEKQIYELARALRQKGHEVHVVSLDCRGQAPRQPFEVVGCHLHVFRVVRIYGLSGLIEGLRFCRFLKDHHIDAIFTYHFSSDMWGTFWGHLAGIKMIFSNRRDMGFWRSDHHVAAYKLIHPWVSKIIVVSNSIKDLVIKEESVDPQRIEVIYNGVHEPSPQKNPQALRLELGLKNKDIVLIHVANVRPVKGHKYLLEAFAAIAASRPDVKLLLVGKDDQNGEIHRLAQELDLKEQLLFLGKRDDVADLLKMADICVLPSLSEGMSNSILEYMASQKPVIATRVGGNPELVQNDHNGLLVDKENSQQLKEALLTLINDPGLRQRMGHAGLEIIRKRFSMDAMVNRYELLFKGVRVLHLISSGGMFGAERVVVTLAAKSDGMTPIVGAIHNAHNPHLEIIDEAKKLNLPTVIFGSKGQMDLSTIWQVKKFIQENTIEILHTHNYKSDIIGCVAAKWTGIHWVVTNHLWHSSDPKMKAYEHIDAFLLKFAQRVVGVSQEIKQDMVRRKLNEKSLQVIDNGVPVDIYGSHNRQLRPSLGLDDDDCGVMIIGRLAKEKGHEIFLKAAVQVVNRDPRVKFIMVGDGPLREDLLKLADDLHLTGKVVFTGILTNMPAVYAAGDIMVNASFQEGLPMTILEAMAAKLPIIATDVGAVSEVILNEKNGILLRPGDPEALASALMDLIQDRAKRQRLAEQAYKDVCERFSDTRMAQKYQEVYADVIKSV